MNFCTACGTKLETNANFCPNCGLSLTPNTEPSSAQEPQDTDFETKEEMLSTLYTDYRDEPVFAELLEYNDITLPLSYLMYTGLVAPEPQAFGFIIEAFEMLLNTLEIEDRGFTTIDEMLTLAGKEG